MKYRREIDGLRAVALLPVLLFHVDNQFLKGGYIGVDIFFVISGYLVTSIILSDLKDSSFSFRNFYERRARRILPAITIMMLVVTPIAYLLMLPDDLENYGQSVIATIFFSNNILLWLTSGYFALAVDFKPLAHTWSLGIEEQYYIIAPILLILMHKVKKKNFMSFSIIALTILSFSYCQWSVSRYPEATFFLIFSRAWELGIGSILSIISKGQVFKQGTKIAELLSVLGMILILVFIFTFDKNTAHPSYLTLIPITGTSLIILFCGEKTYIGRLLCIRLMTILGLASYSIYLWHQPVLAFLRIVSLEEPRDHLLYAGLLFATIIGILSWKFIEAPFRIKNYISAKIFLSFITIPTLILAALGWYFHSTSGLYHKWPELSNEGSGYGPRYNNLYNLAAKRFLNDDFPNETKNKNILIIGDSYARDFINAGLENGYFSNHNISYTDLECKSFAAGKISSRLNRLIIRSEVIVFGYSLDREITDCLKQSIGSLGKTTSAKFVVLGTKNFGWNNNAVMLLTPEKRYSYKAKILEEFILQNNEASARFPPSIYVNILSMISDEGGRVPIFTPDRKLISQDRNHLTKFGAQHIGQIIFEHETLKNLK